MRTELPKANVLRLKKFIIKFNILTKNILRTKTKNRFPSNNQPKENLKLVTNKKIYKFNKTRKKTLYSCIF